MDSSDFVKDGYQAGLWKITPTSVTNGTVGANGDVTIATAVTNTTVSGCFSSKYSDYLIIISGINTSSGSNWFEFRFLSGHTTGYYGHASVIDFGGTSINQATNNLGRLLVGRTSTGTSFDSISINVSRPFQASAKGIHGTSAGNRGQVLYGGTYQTATSFTGFYFNVSAGTMTGGTIKVYGYN
jgi:hypothetical protein